jgi:hypothetical protein
MREWAVADIVKLDRSFNSRIAGRSANLTSAFLQRIDPPTALDWRIFDILEVQRDPPVLAALSWVLAPNTTKASLYAAERWGRILAIAAPEDDLCHRVALRQ